MDWITEEMHSRASSSSAYGDDLTEGGREMHSRASSSSAYGDDSTKGGRGGLVVFGTGKV